MGIALPECIERYTTHTHRKHSLCICFPYTVPFTGWLIDDATFRVLTRKGATNAQVAGSHFSSTAEALAEAVRQQGSSQHIETTEPKPTRMNEWNRSTALIVWLAAQFPILSRYKLCLQFYGGR
jgi:hypothetical protein